MDRLPLSPSSANQIKILHQANTTLSNTKLEYIINTKLENFAS